MQTKALIGGKFVAGEGRPEAISEPGDRQADGARCAWRRETVGLR